MIWFIYVDLSNIILKVSLMKVLGIESGTGMNKNWCNLQHQPSKSQESRICIYIRFHVKDFPSSSNCFNMDTIRNHKKHDLIKRRQEKCSTERPNFKDEKGSRKMNHNWGFLATVIKVKADERFLSIPMLSSRYLLLFLRNINFTFWDKTFVLFFSPSL